MRPTRSSRGLLVAAHRDEGQLMVTLSPDSKTYRARSAFAIGALVVGILASGAVAAMLSTLPSDDLQQFGRLFGMNF